MLSKIISDVDAFVWGPVMLVLLVRCHPLDPSNDPTCSSSIRDHGIACKTIFDCTVPYDQKERFKRARFMEVDPEHWLS